MVIKHWCKKSYGYHNTQGSYTCYCRQGYVGDGQTCTGKVKLSWLSSVDVRNNMAATTHKAAIHVIVDRYNVGDCQPCTITGVWPNINQHYSYFLLIS